ncbi:MAG: alpha/beta hydrolase, partial [Acidobacteriota bacterium]|nr:alpha/beta hydrolase [Acidobacteriota bacterium]
MYFGTKPYKQVLGPVLPNVFSDEELERLSVPPTLFLIGSKEQMYPADKAVHRIQEVAPDVTCDVLPEAGHLLTALHAEEVSERIVTFLE